MTSPTAPLKTSITVVGELATESPSDITVLNQQQVLAIPGVNIDDRLRNIPGFSLFRRTSSLVANPTTQGVSLRGLGSTGASRTLVLWDGIPLNDPFGGWVYWDRVDPAELSRIEVTRSASTSAFGDRALGGVLSMFSREAERGSFTAEYEGGNLGTNQVSLGFSDILLRHWALSGNARAFDTDGYYIVPSYRRGPVDVPANVEFVGGDVRFDYLGGPNQMNLKFDALAEARGNGTALTTNSTSLGEFSAHYSHDSGTLLFSILGYHEREQYHSVFSSVNAARTIETLSYTQTVPSDATGGAAYLQYRKSRYTLLAGVDTQRAGGTSFDRYPTFTRVGGGVLLQTGIFAQGNATFGNLRVFAGAREQWTGLGSTLFSPSAGAVYSQQRLRYRGSLYRSYRAPTLNELYRDFKVGNTTTLSNPYLQPETLRGGELGVDYVLERTRLSITGYRTRLKNLIQNVTLATSSNAITRERENASDARAQGVEVNLHHDWVKWQADLGYLYADSRLLNGLRIPQTAKNQGSAELSYTNGGRRFSVGVRAFSLQFDDDQNQFILPGYASLQASVQQRFRGGFSVMAQAENLLDRTFYTGYTPTPTIGSPRLIRAGIRWESRGRRQHP